MAKIVVINAKDTKKEFILQEDKFKIGRGKENDLLLSEPTISRKHALIKNKNGKYILTNFGKNGTKVNGELIKSRYLKDGDKIEIGSVTILYQEEPTDTQSDTKTTSQKGISKKLIYLFLILVVIILGVFIFLSRSNEIGTTSPSSRVEENQIIEKINSSEGYFELARRLYREREIKEENLFLAIQAWQEGLDLLGKSEDTEKITTELKEAEEELNKKINDEMFEAYQSYHLGNLSGCKLHLERVLKLVPSQNDRRYQSALAKLKVLNQNQQNR